MDSSQIVALILAAGQSSRFNTTRSKLSHTLCGQELILYPIKLLASLSVDTVIVVGYQQEIIKNIILQAHVDSIIFCEQKERKGTGHAVLCTRDTWTAEHILIMNGDMPLVSKSLIQEVLDLHFATQATVTFVTAFADSSQVAGYGRVIKHDQTLSIIEARDFTGDTTQESLINAGIYLIKKSFLECALKQLQVHSNSGELYLTDVIKLASIQNERVETVNTSFDIIRGINTLKELHTTEHIKRSELIEFWMNHGVRFNHPETVHIDADVIIEQDTYIGTGVQLRKGTRIGKGCIIESFSTLSNSIIHDSCVIDTHSVITDSTINACAHIGPFAHVRKQSIIGDQAIIGNFVEVSHSTIGNNTKAKHLSYIGTAQIGSKVNIGAGAITCNYNGYTKNTTTIKDKASIGSNSCLIAPVTIGKEGVVGAGSVISQNVPDYALALTRAEQITKQDYALKLKQRFSNTSKSPDTVSFIAESAIIAHDEL